MLLILEGPNKAGKTTLVGAIQPDERLRLRRGAPKEGRSIYAEYLTFDGLAGYVTSSSHLVVADRWHLGELVYGPLMRGTSGSNKQVHEIHDILMQWPVAVAFVIPPIGTLSARLDASPDEYVPSDKTVSEYVRWQNVSDRFVRDYPTRCFEVATHDFDFNLHYINQHIARHL